MATIIGEELGIPVEVDSRLRLDGNFRDFFPPHDLHGYLLISHLPVITRILRAWSERFHHPSEPRMADIGTGYCVDMQQQSIEFIRP